MRKHINIIQYVPYYPPHIGGVENAAAVFARYWSQDHGTVLTVTSSVWQSKDPGIYTVDGTSVLILPSFDLLAGYPVPKIWNRQFWLWLQHIYRQSCDITMTHTRFFLFTVLWGILSLITKTPRIHVEHGSWFVAWYNKFVSFLSYVSDMTLSKWVLYCCDHIVVIAVANISFIKKLSSKAPSVIYNGVVRDPHPRVPDTIYTVWYVWRLVTLKWLHTLLHAYTHIRKKIAPSQLLIIGDGDHAAALQTLAYDLWILEYTTFVGIASKSDLESIRYPQIDLFVNPSTQEWLPTTIIEALLSGCQVLATHVWWVWEILDQDDMFAPGDVDDLADAIYTKFVHRNAPQTNIDVERFVPAKSILEYKKLFKDFL